MITEGYQMDLYCDNMDEGKCVNSGHYNGKSRPVCVLMARKDGWVFRGRDNVVCKSCRDPRGGKRGGK